MLSQHTFHIPVMGTGFTIDTPVKVAKYGISSVISLVDDDLIEEMRQFYSELHNVPYEPITRDDEDYRARRITEYLNLLDIIVNNQFEKLRLSPFEKGSEITKYFKLLPETAPLKNKYNRMVSTADPELKKSLQDELRTRITPGSINVNIMTKLDRKQYDKDNNPLSEDLCDAIAALRGYAKSKLNSAIIFSAGINRHLYTYAERFKDFYADATGFIKKKIILKVTDYRSSVIQGKFFAKKGLWVSEYRVESGLNCGGHAFASNGNLMGPILEEFKKKKDVLISTVHKIYNEARRLKQKATFNLPHEVEITAQGGIGTSQSNTFLLRYFKLNRTGWGTPFLLTPQATNVEKETLQKLAEATEEDIELSGISPLNVPFYTLKNSSSEVEKKRRVEDNSPGSPCFKGHLAFNTEFTEKPVCTASKLYQKLKAEHLKKLNLSPEALKTKLKEIWAKACICNDLGESTRLKYNLGPKDQKKYPAVCPGPNIAYFNKITSLEEMVGHIYGKINVLKNISLPNLFLKELKLYIKHFIKEVQNAEKTSDDQQIRALNDFLNNLFEGISYYRGLFPKMVEETHEYREKALKELEELHNKICGFVSLHLDIFPLPAEELVPTLLN